MLLKKSLEIKGMHNKYQNIKHASTFGDLCILVVQLYKKVPCVEHHGQIVYMLPIFIYILS